MPDLGTLIRLAVIGAVMLIVAGAFAYTGGWLSPGLLTADRVMAAFEADDGVHPGFRHNHAKGLCVTGWFESNGQAAALSRAALFKPGRVPVVGRFALGGGMPFKVDEPAGVRSLALQFLAPDGTEWRTGMINLPVLPVRTPQGFYDLLMATVPDPATHKPDPARFGAFLSAHPETAAALAIITKGPPSTGFTTETYNSINAFRFVDAAGTAVPVRWSTVPVPGGDATSAAPTGPNYLFDEVIAAIARQKLQLRLIIIRGQPGDPTNDATLPWPADRPRVDAGTLTLDHAESEDGGPCTAVNYDPLVLPPGIEPSDDPLLGARSAAYSRSFTLRADATRQKPPSAVTPAEVRAGGRP